MDSAQVANGVFVAARPVPVQVTPGRTAVVVVDMQNDFGSIGGMFEQAGVDISEIRAMIPTISALIPELAQARAIEGRRARCGTHGRREQGPRARDMEHGHR